MEKTIGWVGLQRPKLTPSDPHPPIRLHLLVVPQPSQTVLLTENKDFKYVSLHFTQPIMRAKTQLNENQVLNVHDYRTASFQYYRIEYVLLGILSYIIYFSLLAFCVLVF